MTNQERLSRLAAKYDALNERARVGHGFNPAFVHVDIGADDAAAIRRELESQAALLAALKALRIDANRLCDRQLGGTYEDDCRRSIAVADAAIAKAEGRA